MRIIARIFQLMFAFLFYFINIFAEWGIDDEKVPSPVEKKK